MFHAPGVWQIIQCPNATCGLLWLDPVPVEDDLPLIYQDYFTHQPRSPAVRSPGRSVIHWLYRALLCATGVARQRADLLSFYLRGTQPGRLLDVGCGDGGQLARLRDMGWEVEGQELDMAAAERARVQHGLRVHIGALQVVGLPEAIFDVVTMSHVIEHVHDPLALLKECHRILKPGGSLIAVTPNANGYGHHCFHSNWMPLEPPRHLHLFSPPTLRQLAHLAGFSREECWTTAAKAQFFYEASRDIQQAGRHDVTARPGLRRGLQAMAFQFRAMAVQLVRKDSGDECVLRARK